MNKISYPPDKKINEVLSSHGVNWQSSDVSGLSFLGDGRAKDSWKNYSSDIRVVWDRIGRVWKTRSGTEWLLEKRYHLMDEWLTSAKALSFENTIEPQVFDSTDLHSRVSIIEFLRTKAVCCRMLFVYPSAFSEMVKSEINRIGVFQNPKIKMRVFLLEYDQ